MTWPHGNSLPVCRVGNQMDKKVLRAPRLPAANVNHS
jgi:hypothetical protein